MCCPTKGQLERADMTYVTDTSFPMLVSQYTPAVIEPIGQRKAFWWIVGQLGKRMGLDFFPGFDLESGTDDRFLEYILAQLRNRFRRDARRSA